MRLMVLAAAVANVIKGSKSLNEWELRDYVVSQVVADDTGVYDLFQPVISTNNFTNNGIGKFGGKCPRIPANSAFRMANNPFLLYGDFTIEGFFNFETLVASSNQYLYDLGSNGFTLRYYQGYGISVTTPTPIIQTGFVPNQNTWYHIALVRQGGLLKLYIDGVMLGQATYTGSLNYPSGTLGNYGGGGAYSPVGRVDQFRITMAAVYTANFTPPAEAFKYGTNEPDFDPFWSRVKLLVKTNAGAPVNKGSAGVTFTAVGGPAIVSGGRYGGDCMQFPVDGARYNIPYDANAHFNFGSENFTIECWVKPSRSAAAQSLISRRSSGEAGGYDLYLTSLKPTFRVASSPTVWGTSIGNISGSEIPLNRWTHLAASRLGSYIYLFVNGKLIASDVFSSSVVNSNLPLSIGASSDGTMPFQGLIDRVRITRGAPRYTSNFIPRLVKDFAETANQGTAQLTVDPYWGNVPLLLPFDRSIDTGPDQMLLVLQRTGIALDNTRQLFGKQTLKIDTGATGGINYNNVTKPLLGNYDCSVECWVNTNHALAENQVFIGQNHSSSAGAWFLGEAFGKARFFIRGGIQLDGTRNISDGNWHHVAVSIVSGMVYLHVDGFLEASATLTQAPSYNGNIQVGYNMVTDISAGYRLNIARVRVTQGKGRYNAAFTPGEQTIALSSAAA